MDLILAQTDNTLIVTIDHNLLLFVPNSITIPLSSMASLMDFVVVVYYALVVDKAIKCYNVAF